MPNNDNKIATTIRIPEDEHKLAEKMAIYLYKNNLIERESLNEAYRYAMLYLANVIASSHEAKVNQMTQGETNG